jgi:hypothetical protein
MPRVNEGNLTIEDARIIFRNFAGREGKYNREGDRNFCILLDAETAEQLDRDGWNVKALRSREEGDPDQPYLQVSVGFKNRPPLIVLVTRRGRTTLGEDEIEVVDWIDIRSVDLIIRPYKWEVSGKTGIKAYLKSLYVIVEEDELAIKYEDLEQLPSRSGRVDEGRALPAGTARERYDIDGEVV